MVHSTITSKLTKNLKWLIPCLLLAALATVVILYFALTTSTITYEDDTRKWVYPEQVVARGAVVSNGGPCAEVGRKILKKYGNAVDSIIATMLCDGLICLPYFGVGGGFMATIYKKNESKVETLVSREVAPAAAKPDMFVKNFTLSKKGGLAVAVPGELMGYWEMYKKYGGSAPWKELFTDAINMCKEGVPVNKRFADRVVMYRDEILSSPTLRKLLENERGEFPKLGDKIKMPKLAETLTRVANEGPSVLYNGSLTAGLVKDIQNDGGIITEEDMNSYRVRWEPPVHVQLTSGLHFYSVGPPASGHLLGFILNVLNDTLKAEMDAATNVSIITETFKYAYAMRSHFGDPYFTNMSEILKNISDSNFVQTIKKKVKLNETVNDPKFYGSDYYNQDDFGTANFAVIAPNGDAVTATSTINLLFGSGLVSESTGLLLNNQMDDFSTPGLVNGFGVYPSPANFIAPGKRPQSSVCPSIIIDKNGDVRLLAGAAGGTKITTSTALTIIQNIWHNTPIAEAVELPRFHHQLMPMEWQYEPSMPQEIVSSMKARGHKVVVLESAGVVTSLTKNGDLFGAASDLRRPGNTSYLLLPCTCP